MPSDEFALPYRSPEEIQAKLEELEQTAQRRADDGDPIKLTQQEFDAAYAEHQQWLNSDKKSGRRMDLQHRDFLGIRFEAKANLQEALLNRSVFTHCNLPGARCESAHLWGANFKDALLYDARFSSANLSHAAFVDAKLEKAELKGAYLNAADFSGASLRSANLFGVVAFKCIFRNSNLQGADLQGAQLYQGIFSGADLTGAQLDEATLAQSQLEGAVLSLASMHKTNLLLTNLSGANLKNTKLSDADLRDARGIVLDETFIRDARFSPVRSRLWALSVNVAFPPIRSFLRKTWLSVLADRLEYEECHADLWSVLRQSYAGPKAMLSLLFLIAFAMPYIMRAGFWSSVSAAEPMLIRVAESRIRDGAGGIDVIRSYSSRLSEARRVLEEAPVNPASTRAVDLLSQVEKKMNEKIDGVESELKKADQYLKNAGRRPLWMVVLQLHKKGIWPASLALMLIVYNGCIYFLVTGVGPLRDQEERSGFSPALPEYAKLRLLHRVACILFYVSLFAFMLNIFEMLTQSVLLPPRG